MQLLHVIDRASIEIRIWERGAGYALASGSSFCAAAAASHKLGMVGREIEVKMSGGSLSVEIRGNEGIYMNGPVEGVFLECFHPDVPKKVSGCKEN